MKLIINSLGLIILLAIVTRFYGLNTNPPALFGDELDVGYQAYSILRTGKDYTGHLLPLQFKSFDEYRAPLYIYSAVPTVAFFGITPLGVRLPAMIFGVLGVYLMYLLVGEVSGRKALGLVAAFVLTISPWHINYSRAGFEVTLLLTLLLAGIYFFIRGLGNAKWLIPSSVCFALAPWVYSTAKLFIPVIVVFTLVVWYKEILKINKKYLLIATSLFMIISIPCYWSNFFGGGNDRFALISVFNDPTTEGNIGLLRTRDKEMSSFIVQTFQDRVIHNKYFYWSGKIISNYFQATSAEFLFVTGDSNLRHNSSGAGELYKIEAVFLLLGFYFFLRSNIGLKQKLLLVFWMFFAPIPSALTADGGNHATRLILMLPPLVVIITFGLVGVYDLVGKKYKNIYIGSVVLLYLISFCGYQHYYWIHYPWDSEKWWQAGWKETIKLANFYAGNNQKVIISSSVDPALKYYLSFSQYPPEKYMNDQNPEKLDNIYFPQVGQSIGLYDLGARLDKGSIYVAPAQEFQLDLIKEPFRVPSGLQLKEVIKYPSGTPAFYFLTKT